MEFDVVVSNPPYNDGIDTDFIKLGVILAKESVYITPAKWQTAESSSHSYSHSTTYGELRELLSNRIDHLIWYPQSKDVFEIYQTDGIVIFHISKNIISKTRIENRCKSQPLYNNEQTRDLSGGITLNNLGFNILKEVWHKDSLRAVNFNDLNTIKGRYVVCTNNQISTSGGKILSCGGQSLVIGVSRIIDRFSSDFARGVEGARDIIFSSDSEQECKSFISWLDSKPVRFLVSINVSKLTGILNNHCFRYVPEPPKNPDGTYRFDHIYTDEEMYKEYGLSDTSIKIIDTVISDK